MKYVVNNFYWNKFRWKLEIKMFVLCTQNILLIRFYWFSYDNATDEWCQWLYMYLVLFFMVLCCKNITNVFGSKHGSMSDRSLKYFCYALISTNVQYLKWNEFMVKLCVLNSNETWKRYDISKWFETYTQSVRKNVDALGCFTFNLIVTWSCFETNKEKQKNLSWICVAI